MTHEKIIRQAESAYRVMAKRFVRKHLPELREGLSSLPFSQVEKLAMALAAGEIARKEAA